MESSTTLSQLYRIVESGSVSNASYFPHSAVKSKRSDLMAIKSEMENLQSTSQDAAALVKLINVMLLIEPKCAGLHGKKMYMNCCDVGLTLLRNVETRPSMANLAHAQGVCNLYLASTNHLPGRIICVCITDGSQSKAYYPQMVSSGMPVHIIGPDDLNDGQEQVYPEQRHDDDTLPDMREAKHAVTKVQHWLQRKNVVSVSVGVVDGVGAIVVGVVARGLIPLGSEKFPRKLGDVSVVVLEARCIQASLPARWTVLKSPRPGCAVSPEACMVSHMSMSTMGFILFTDSGKALIVTAGHAMQAANSTLQLLPPGTPLYQCGALAHLLGHFVEEVHSSTPFDVALMLKQALKGASPDESAGICNSFQVAHDFDSTHISQVIGHLVTARVEQDGLDVAFVSATVPCDERGLDDGTAPMPSAWVYALPLAVHLSEPANCWTEMGLTERLETGKRLYAYTYGARSGYRKGEVDVALVATKIIHTIYPIQSAKQISINMAVDKGDSGAVVWTVNEDEEAGILGILVNLEMRGNGGKKALVLPIWDILAFAASCVDLL